MDPLDFGVVIEVERDCVLDGLDDMANAAATSTVLAIPHVAVGRTLWFAAAQHHATNEERHGSLGSFGGASEDDPQRCTQPVGALGCRPGLERPGNGSRVACGMTHPSVGTSARLCGCVQSRKVAPSRWLRTRGMTATTNNTAHPIPTTSANARTPWDHAEMHSTVPTSPTPAIETR